MNEDNDNPFLSVVVRHFGDLLENEGFALVDQSYGAESFGDAAATCHSLRMAIRFQRDKGVVFVEFGAKRPRLELAQLVSYLDPKSTAVQELRSLDSTKFSTADTQLAALRRVVDEHRRNLFDPAFYNWQERKLKRFLATGDRFPAR